MSGTDAREIKRWSDQDLTEAFLLITQTDPVEGHDLAVLAEMNRRALGAGRDEDESRHRPRLWDYQAAS